MKHNWISGYARVVKYLGAETENKIYLLELLHESNKIFIRGAFHKKKAKIIDKVVEGQYIKFDGYVNLDDLNYILVFIENVYYNSEIKPEGNLETIFEYSAKILKISDRDGFGKYNYVTLNTESFSPNIFGSTCIRLVCGYHTYSKILLPVEDSDLDLVNFRGCLMKDNYNNPNGKNKKLTFIVTKVTVF